MTEMAACAKEHTINGCDSASRPPALAIPCAEWARCMNRDPRRVGRARVSAHTFAHIFNSFIEPISYKAMFFTLFLTFGLFLLVNGTFGFFRKQHHADPFMNGPPGWIPPTPHRQASGGHYALYAAPGTPYHGSQEHGYFLAGPASQSMLGLEPAPSAVERSVSGGSPGKRR